MDISSKALVTARLAQICASLMSEGWFTITKSEWGLWMRHPNGSRMSVIAYYTDCEFAYLKDGRLVKTEPFPPKWSATPARKKPEAVSTIC